MGQAFSNGNALAIHLDRPVYHPGDLVNGLVSVLLTMAP
jgi:hypothetical protein